MPRKPSKITSFEAAMTDKDDREAIEQTANEMIEWIKGRIQGNNQLPIAKLTRTDMLNLAMAAVSRWILVRQKQEDAQLSDPIDDLWRPDSGGELAQLLA